MEKHVGWFGCFWAGGVIRKALWTSKETRFLKSMLLVFGGHGWCGDLITRGEFDVLVITFFFSLNVNLWNEMLISSKLIATTQHQTANAMLVTIFYHWKNPLSASVTCQHVKLMLISLNLLDYAFIGTQKGWVLWFGYWKTKIDNQGS